MNHRACLNADSPAPERARASAARASLSGRLLALFLCCICLTGIPACSGDSGADLRAEGQKLLREGNANGAVVFFKNALEKDPADFDSRLGLARAYIKLGKLPQAEGELQKNLRQRPADPPLNLELAAFQMLQGKPERALEYLLKAEESGKRTAESREMTGAAYGMLGKNDEAEAALLEALRLEPERESASLTLARVYLAKRDPAKALALSDALLAARPKSVNALALRAELARRMNDTDRAIAIYRSIAELEPKNNDVRYLLGTLLLQRGKNDDAKTVLEAMRRDAAGGVRLFMLEGLYAYQTGNYKDAAGFFQNSVDAAPTIEGYYRLGMSLNRTGNQESALSQLRRVLDVSPRHAPSLRLMVSILLRQGRADDARREAEKLAGYYPDDAGARYLLGTALSAAGDSGKALEELARATELDPRMSEAAIRRGSLLIAEGRYQEAGDDLAKAVAHNADNLAARVALFQFHLGRRNYAESDKLVREGLEKQPDNAVLLTMRAQLLAMQNRTTEALAAVRKARTADPDLVESLTLEQRLYIQDGQKEKALESCQAYLARHPDAVPQHIAAAALLDMSGRRDEAAALLRKAYDLGEKRALFLLVQRALDEKKPDEARTLLQKDLDKSPSIPARDALARLYASERNFDAAWALYENLEKTSAAQAALGKFRLLSAAGKNREALAQARRLSELDVSSSLGALCAAGILEKTDQPREALKELDDAYRRLQQPVLLVAMAEFCQRRGEWEKADAYYQTALRLSPNDRGALSGKALLLMQRRRYGEAIDHYERLQKLDPQNAVVSNNLAMAYAESGQNPERALHMATLAFVQQPENPQILDTLASCLLLGNRADDAVKLLLDALKLHPVSAQLHYRLGAALARVNKPKEARAALRKSLEMGDFSDAEAARKLLQTL